MQSKHAFILALLTSAIAILSMLGGLLILSFLDLAEPYLSAREDRKQARKEVSITAPNFTTKLEGTQTQIFELDDNGQSVKLVYVSELNDSVADFSLFAVPQTNYTGKIYVASVKDAEKSLLIVYPLTVDTGHLGAAVLNVVSHQVSLSPDQSRVAVVNTTQPPNITAYDIASGVILATWELDTNEYLDENLHWINNDCFEHATRTLCLKYD